MELGCRFESHYKNNTKTMFVKIQVQDNNGTVVRESLTKFSGQDYNEIIEKLTDETFDHLKERRAEWLKERGVNESDILNDENGEEYVFYGGYSDYVDGESIDHPNQKEYLPNYISKLYA